MKSSALILLMLITIPFVALAADTFQTDTIKTSQGDLKITFISHGTLMLQFNDKVIQVDPWSKLADYSKLPKADLVLVTHEHQDHLDLNAIEKTKKSNTKVIMNKNSAAKGAVGEVMKNGDVETVDGVKIEAVPAYNLVHMRQGSTPFHPKGDGNGYILTVGDKRVYIAGDTENTPEMKALKNIDVAFLPMNLPYTMTPDMVVDAVMAFKPKVLYPYHTGDTNLDKLLEKMKSVKGVETRKRQMK